MTTTKALWDKQKSVKKVFLSPLPKSQGKRTECLHNCGRFVTHEMGECRKCKKARLRAGLKRIKKNA